MHMRKGFLLTGLVLLGVGLWYSRGVAPRVATEQVRELVKVPKGASARQIADMLYEEGVIRSPLAFRIFVILHGMADMLQAGSFVVRPSMSVAEVVNVLTNGKAEEVILTIPEGFTVADLDGLVTQKGLAEQGAMLECVRMCDFSSFAFLPESGALAERGGTIEGYLFPDTYFVLASEFQPKAFLERLLSTFQRKVVEGMSDEIKRSRRGLHVVVTMASLIEEETRTAEERPIVSGILWKRHDANMGLGVDAAVRYILEKPTGALTSGDLNVNSPYNLRKFRGLPPGPIANPGVESIRAALHPKESPYWYYLHDAEGAIHYATSNDEHNVNRMEYLR
jgi:UPF0755 protein